MLSQYKVLFILQPFDEEGRRISALPSAFGMRLFSILDDGSGFTSTESILDVWIEEGVENSAEILQVSHLWIILQNEEELLGAKALLLHTLFFSDFEF